MVYIASSKSSEPKRFVQRFNKVERKYIQQKQPLLQPEHGICRQNGPELGQGQSWYVNEKLMVILVCLNDQCCSSECADVVSY